jgi:hypothetical protein
MPILGTIASSTRQGLATNSFESIATVSGTGSSATVTFSSIPSTYSILQIRCNWFSTASNNPYMRFNGDTAGNYSWTHLYGEGAGATALQNNSTSAAFIYWGLSGDSNTPNSAIIDINNYASTSKTKVAKIFAGQDYVSAGEIAHWAGVWNNSSTAINSISLTTGVGNISATSTFALFGIKG